MQTRHLLAVAFVAAAAAGCEEPPNILPATAPGQFVDRIPKEEKDIMTGPQAVGEAGIQRDSAPTGSSSKAKSAPAVLAQTPIVPAPATRIGETKTTPGGVKYKTLHEGTGVEVKIGDLITVNYRGTLDNGSVFDSGEHVNFKVGVRKLIRGWDESIVGMKVGEKRELTIPSELGYGSQGSPPKIPPDSTLHFEVEVLGVD